MLQWSTDICWSLGYTKRDKEQAPGESLLFPCGRLQRLIRNHIRRSWGTLLMARVSALGAPDSSCKQPKATHEVLSWTRTCQREAETPQIAKKTHNYLGRHSIVRWPHQRWKHIFYQRRSVLQADTMTYLDDVSEKVGTRKLVPVIGIKWFGHRRAKPAWKASDSCPQQLFLNFEIRSLFFKPYIR